MRTYSVYFKFQTNDNSLASRSSGELVDDEKLSAEFKIMNGEEDNFAIIFDNNGYYDVYPMKLQTATVLNGHTHTIDAVYGVKLSVDAEKKIGTYSCLVVLNAPELYKELKKLKENAEKGETPMSEILSMVWNNADDPRRIGRYEEEGHDTYFTMTSSVYFDKDGSQQVEVKISDDNIIETSDTAETIRKKIITVHVERMVAKFSFGLPEGDQTIFYPNDADDTQEDFPGGSGIMNTDIVMFDGFAEDGSLKYAPTRWRIKITGWGINALEQSETFFKQINKSDGYLSGWNWNDAENYRSYWSVDQNYDEPEVYPWQYRWAMDSPKIIYYKEKEKGNVLRNYSFNELSLGGDNFGTVLYTPENTFNWATVKDKSVLNGRDELLACSHLLLGAELQIKDEASAKADGATVENGYVGNHDWYRDRSGFYYRSEQECFAALVHAFNRTLESQDVMEFIPYDWERGDTITVELPAGLDKKEYSTTSLVANTSGGYSIYYYDGHDYKPLTKDVILANYEGPMAKATLKGGDAKRLPWIEDAIDNGWLTIRNGDKELLTFHYRHSLPNGDVEASQEIVADKDKDHYVDYVKSLLYEWLGAVDHFCNGKMYYPRGIDNPLSKTEEESMPGRYGVVRNNWYRFILSDVNSMGIPVDDPDQPIIPERVESRDQINLSIKILDWHEFNTSIPGFPN